MKLALIGGGGVRAPEFVRGALAFARDLDLRELWLMDVDPARLAMMTPLCRMMVQQAGIPIQILPTTKLDEAVRDAGMIVTTVRVGFEHSRVLDERIALNMNLLGQETTGAGGFSMAMRSIPVLMSIAERVEALAPKAWMFNFTNPEGLVVQALYDAGFRRVIGISDRANSAQSVIANWLKRSAESVKTEVFGLNHLSWTRRALVEGRNVLPELLADDSFINATHLRFFGADLIRRMDLFLNEYLFFYYFRDLAIERIKQEPQTRGEEVEMLNRGLLESLRGLTPAEALRAYDAYNRRRSASYMAYAETDEQMRAERANPGENTDVLHQEQIGGYAGVALRTAVALMQDRPLRIALNVPNNGAITGMRSDDIVEVTCDVDGSGAHPLALGEVPEDPYLLMRSVKRYERLAVQAILNRDRALAVEALVAHPLIGSYHLAAQLVEAYLEAQREYVGEWD
ncbi:MAG TPA: hypothetical protein VHD90_25365 [Phototrophicaceae bacterium]|nr:hypothetical protein [Phototrophicaceae bacterium]